MPLPEVSSQLSVLDPWSTTWNQSPVVAAFSFFGVDPVTQSFDIGRARANDAGSIGSGAVSWFAGNWLHPMTAVRLAIARESTPHLDAVGDQVSFEQADYTHTPFPDRSFDVIWQSINPVRADAWSRYIPDSAKRTADWTFPWVCGGCIEPTFKEW